MIKLSRYYHNTQMDLTLKCQINCFFIEMHFDISYIFSKFSTHYVHLFHNSMELCPLFLSHKQHHWLCHCFCSKLTICILKSIEMILLFIFSTTFDKGSLTFWVINFSKTWQLQEWFNWYQIYSSLYGVVMKFRNKICNLWKHTKLVVTKKIRNTSQTKFILCKL